MKASSRILALAGLLALGFGGPLSAQLDPDKVVTPRSNATSENEPTSPTTFVETPPVVSIVLYGVLLTAVGFVVYRYVWRGGFSLKRSGGTSGIQISESKPLGNKQYIVVVECDDQRMMLGVGPGFINHLCFLDQTNPPADDAIDLPEVPNVPSSRS